MPPDTVPSATAKRLLSRVIGVAQLHEETVLRVHQQTPLQAVAYSTLVRTRRLARAIHTLCGDGSYESRLLFRTIVELYFNYSWIKLAPRVRATRYMRFDVLERLRLIEDMPASDPPSPALADTIRVMRRQRTRLRYLFRVRTRAGHSRWARDWSPLSFRERVQEVQEAHRKPSQQIDTFAYGLYRWLSTNAHGGPSSMNEVLERTRWGIRPVPQPDNDPSTILLATTVLLLGVLAHCSSDLHFSPASITDLEHLMDKARQMAGLPSPE